MQLRRYLPQLIVALFLLSMLVSMVGTAKTSHASTKKVQHVNTSGGLQWPFSPAEGPWSIISGYNDDNTLLP